ncbi:MAG: N-acetylmuramoyl-L-alanine amidase [Candidatus Woesearchaeota archaeon]
MDSQKVLFAIIFSLISGLVLMTFWQYNITNFFTKFDGSKISNAISRLENIERVDKIKSCNEVLKLMADNRIITNLGSKYYTNDFEDEIDIKRTNTQSTKTISIDENKIKCELYSIEVDYEIKKTLNYYSEDDSYDEPKETEYNTKLSELSKEFINEIKDDRKIDLVDETGKLESFGKITPKRIIIHHTGGSDWEGAYKTLKSRGLGAHFIIEKDGAIRMYVNLDEGTYHACSANFETIGIEIVNDGLTEEFTEAQYYSTKKVVEFLKNKLSNKLNPFVLGHFEVDEYYQERFERYNCAKGKWDPSPDFDWSKIGVDKNRETVENFCMNVENDESLNYQKECYVVV